MSSPIKQLMPIAINNTPVLPPPNNATPSRVGQWKLNRTWPTSIFLAAYAPVLARSETASSSSSASALTAHSLLSPPTRAATAHPRNTAAFSPSSSCATLTANSSFFATAASLRRCSDGGAAFASPCAISRLAAGASLLELGPFLAPMDEHSGLTCPSSMT